MSALLRQLESRLLEKGLPREHFEEAAVQAERTGLSLFELLKRSQNVDPGLLCATLSELTGLEARTEVDLEAIDVDLVRQIPLGHAREQGILPLGAVDGVVDVAISSPETVDAADDLRVLFGQPVRLVLLPHNTLRDAINKAFDKAARQAVHQFNLSQGKLNLVGELRDTRPRAELQRFKARYLSEWKGKVLLENPE